MASSKKATINLNRMQLISKLEQVKVTVENSEADYFNRVYKCTNGKGAITVDEVKRILMSGNKEHVDPPPIPDIKAPDYNQTVFDENEKYISQWKISHEHFKQTILEFYVRYVSMYVHSTTVTAGRRNGPHTTRFDVPDIWSTLVMYWYKSDDRSLAENMFFYSYKLLMDHMLEKENRMLEVLHNLTTQDNYRNLAFNVLLLSELCHHHFNIHLFHYSAVIEKDAAQFSDRNDCLIYHVHDQMKEPPTFVETDNSLVLISTDHCDELRICVRHCPDISLCNKMLKRLVNTTYYWTDNGHAWTRFPNHYPLWSYRKRLASMAFKPADWQEQPHFTIKGRHVYHAPTKNISLKNMESMDTVMKEHSYDFHKYGVKCFQLNQEDIDKFSPGFPAAFPQGAGTRQSDRMNRLKQNEHHEDTSVRLKFYVQSVQRNSKQSAIFDLVHMSEKSVETIRKKISDPSQLEADIKEKLATKYAPHFATVFKDFGISDPAEATTDDDDHETIMSHNNPAPSTNPHGKRVSKLPKRLQVDPSPVRRKKLKQFQDMFFTERMIDVCVNVQNEMKPQDGRLELNIQEADNLSKKEFRGTKLTDYIVPKISNTTLRDKLFYLYHIQCDSPFAEMWPKRDEIAKDNLIRTVLKHVNLGGISTWMEFLALGDSLFSYHNENDWLGAINYCAGGYGKIWFVIPACEALEFEKWLLDETNLRTKCNNVSQHKDVWIDVTDIPDKFTVTAVYQKTGMFVVNAPGALHFGVNVEQNFCTTINFSTRQWHLMTFVSKLCNGSHSSCNTTVLFPAENFLTLIKEYCSINTQLDLNLYRSAFKIPRKQTEQVDDTVDKWIEDMLGACNGDSMPKPTSTATSNPVDIIPGHIQHEETLSNNSNTSQTQSTEPNLEIFDAVDLSGIMSESDGSNRLVEVKTEQDEHVEKSTVPFEIHIEHEQDEHIESGQKTVEIHSEFEQTGNVETKKQSIDFHIQYDQDEHGETGEGSTDIESNIEHVETKDDDDSSVKSLVIDEETSTQEIDDDNAITECDKNSVQSTGDLNSGEGSRQSLDTTKTQQPSKRANPRKNKGNTNLEKCKVENCGIVYQIPKCKGAHFDCFHYFYKCKICGFIGNTQGTYHHFGQHTTEKAELLKQKHDECKSEKRYFLNNMATRETNIKTWYDVPEKYRINRNMKTLEKAKNHTKE